MINACVLWAYVLSLVLYTSGVVAPWVISAAATYITLIAFVSDLPRIWQASSFSREQ